MDELLGTLRAVGYSEKEAKIYLALLTMGPSSVSQIAEKTDLIRTTAYDVLKKLKESGSVSSQLRNGVLLFQAGSPEKIIASFDERKQLIQSIAPQLNNLRTDQPDKPLMELFEGKNGVENIFQDILKQKQPLSAYGNAKFIWGKFPIASPRFIKGRIENKIFVKALVDKSPLSIEKWKSKDMNEYRETRFIQEMGEIPITQYVYGDTVAIIGLQAGEPFGIMIRNSDFAKEQKVIFELLWKKAEK